MYKQTTVIRNKTGLHMRPATEFVAKAKQFSSDISIGRAGGQPGNAKSIVMLLKLALTQGTEIEISAEGGDAQAAVAALIDLINGGFNDL